MHYKSNPDWERIARIIAHYNFPSVSSFAREIGLSRAENLYQIKRGNNGISRELAASIADHFPQVSRGWILTGEGPMLPGEATDHILRHIAGIPFYYDFPGCRPPAEPDKFLYFSKELVGNAEFAVRCNTDEVASRYDRNGVLLLRRWALKDPIIYGELYFVITDYCRLFRIIRSAPGGRVWLESTEAGKYDRVGIPRRDITELYIVIR